MHEASRTTDRATLDDQAEALYRRYGARPWALLPEHTRSHFRSLVQAGIDGRGRPTTGEPPLA
ncbi:hypothetical protein [Pseudonocardia broussonetiae]|uniref:Uncharacterized protein n=1 Tax=Pseudonocardia broussonetiae TaxID=2736640 RepID=A0A6M6JNS3_9PSEU|nr:hypothetical protein [Pseudonocardia broussonetiae]QJY48946.1 hypothetical protein HOP40_26810 [Pseudonocardia broussonetiae]